MLGHTITHWNTGRLLALYSTSYGQELVVFKAEVRLTSRPESNVVLGFHRLRVIIGSTVGIMEVLCSWTMIR